MRDAIDRAAEEAINKKYRVLEKIKNKRKD